MPRSTADTVENSFVRGLITEVTGVNAPENSVVETNNIVYDRRGRAYNRRGFKLEDNYKPNLTVDFSGNKNEFLWEITNDSKLTAFVVLQLGSRIHFFGANDSSALSRSYQSFTVNLLNHKISRFSNQQVREASASFASGKGYLFIAHPCCTPMYVQYDPDEKDISTHEINIKIRDFEGVDDGLPLTQRPTTLSKLHNYNILNQGWDIVFRTDHGDPVIDNFYSHALGYPSNADVFWDFVSIDPDDNKEGLNEDQITNVYRGTTPAAKGHYIVDPFNLDRSEVSGVKGLDVVTSKGRRPSTIAFYAGRVWYAGVNNPDYASTIYFSQIIEGNDQLGKCYQSNDPTNRDAFDLLSSDGGTIKIQDMNSVIDMKVIGTSLYIFASNGVWSISGSNDSGFKATDYNISKASSFPALTKTSIVDVGGFPVWWNYEGIFALQKNEVGTSNITNLSDQTVQSLYDTIPGTSKSFAKGYFNDQESLIYWLYSTEDTGDYQYTNILIYDVITKAFYTFELPDSQYKITGLVAVRTSSPITDEEIVTDNTLGNVTDNLGQLVEVNVEIDVRNQKVFKFVTRKGSNIYFSEIGSELFLDYDTLPYETYFVTGYRIRGDLLKKFQTNYLTVITEKKAGSSCYMQGVWDYSNDPDSGRYTNPQQCYREMNFKNYQRVKLKVRGNGYSLQFRFEGEEGKPFIIVGWAGFETANTVP